MTLLALMADKFELEPIVEEHPSPGAASASSSDVVAFHTDRRVHKAPADGDASILINTPVDKEESEGDTDTSSNNSRQKQETKLLVTFLLMVIVGTANKIFQKLQAIPMYNYPNSLNLLQK